MLYIFYCCDMFLKMWGPYLVGIFEMRSDKRSI